MIKKPSISYRNTFAEFGLGVKTGIDLPKEITGIKGNDSTSGLLLDLAIGQNDTYTPIQLSQYISTIANNGTRMHHIYIKDYIMINLVMTKIKKN